MTSAMLLQIALHYQLSYEATQLGAGQFVGLTCSLEREYNPHFRSIHYFICQVLSQEHVILTN